MADSLKSENWRSASLDEVRQAAIKGNAVAQWELGQRYGEGRGVCKDETEAIRWYRSAAELGYSEAQASLAGCYLFGTGVACDENEAAKWLDKALEGGCGWARLLLDSCLTLIQERAAKGDSYSQSKLAVRYWNGRGVPRDHTQAIAWMRKAAAQGDGCDQKVLADFLLLEAEWKWENKMFAGHEYDRQVNEAINLLSTAAEKGIKSANSSLGDCYAQGIGEIRNYTEAHRQYEIAATDLFAGGKAKEKIKSLCKMASLTDNKPSPELESQFTIKKSVRKRFENPPSIQTPHTSYAGIPLTSAVPTSSIPVSAQASIPKPGVRKTGRLRRTAKAFLGGIWLLAGVTMALVVMFVGGAAMSLVGPIFVGLMLLTGVFALSVLVAETIFGSEPAKWQICIGIIIVVLLLVGLLRACSPFGRAPDEDFDPAPFRMRP